MSFLDIILIIISGAGLIHGCVLSIYLLFLRKNRTLSNILLALLLIVMAIRVGKSVLFIYASDLEFTIILIGLSMLMVLGPLLYFYCMSITRPDYSYHKKDLIHFIPFSILLIISVFATEQWFINHGVFWSFILLAFVYGHFIGYIFTSWAIIPKEGSALTKPQSIVITWGKYFVLGVTVIWFSYVLNIFENQIPYILGPIIYSFTIYFLTYKAFRLNAISYDGSVFREEKENIQLFKTIDTIITTNKLFLDANLHLDKVSVLSSITSHQISSVINEQTGKNFNNYINKYRIEEAKKKLREDEKQQFTISSIAYDVGFNSLSSFNAAFKKFENSTPSQFRNSIK